ncbi:hypothetical protein [Xenorhabdus koppenhoeferi]|uniref:phage tail fiber protein n=1 Tax=Xenorhabdus koppenhoeferi TaxID=351659 RepID=UPI0015A6A74B
MILIQSGNGNLLHMIQAVNSDTELVLADNASVTLNNVTYQIQVTVPDSISDGVRHMVANSSYIVDFLQNMDKWMSQSGTVNVTLPNGQSVSLQSIRALQAGEEGKMSASSGDYNADFRFKQVGTLPAEKNAVMLVSATDIPANSMAAFTRYQWHNNDIQTGIVRGGGVDTQGYAIDINAKRVLTVSSEGIGIHSNIPWGGISVTRPSKTFWSIEGTPDSGDDVLLNFVDRNPDSSNRSVQQLLKGSGVILSLGVNCWRDSNGFIKTASPLIEIHPDGTFTTNDESEGATVTKPGIGHYQVANVLGYNADKAWGVHGGISTPKNNNGLELIYLDDKVQPDGSITIETFHRQHNHLPERFQNNRIKEIVDGEKVYYADGEPCDIPEGCRLDVRVQMPADSVWNVRQGITDGD